MNMPMREPRPADKPAAGLRRLSRTFAVLTVIFFAAAAVILMLKDKAPEPPGHGQVVPSLKDAGVSGNFNSCQPEPAEPEPVSSLPAASLLQGIRLPKWFGQPERNSPLGKGLESMRFGQYVLAKDRLEKALTDFQRTEKEGSPAGIECAALLGLCYEKINRLEKAEELLQQALLNAEKSHPRAECVDLMFAMGKVTYKLHHFFAARVFLQETANHFEDSGVSGAPYIDCLTTLTDCYDQLGDKTMSVRTKKLLAKALCASNPGSQALPPLLRK